MAGDALALAHSFDSGLGVHLCAYWGSWCQERSQALSCTTLPKIGQWAQQSILYPMELQVVPLASLTLNPMSQRQWAQTIEVPRLLPPNWNSGQEVEGLLLCQGLVAWAQHTGRACPFCECKKYSFSFFIFFQKFHRPYSFLKVSHKFTGHVQLPWPCETWNIWTMKT